MLGGQLGGVQSHRSSIVATSQPPQLTARPVVASVCQIQSSRTVKCRAHPILSTSTGGRGNGPFRGSGNNGRFGGGSGPWWRSEGDGEEDGRGLDRDVSANASSGASLRWKGWQERVDADPSFRDKVLIEQIIGVAASVLGDMSSRPHWGLYELDFVFSTLVVGSILNFSLMYFLAPTTGGAAGGGLLQRLFSDVYLRQWGAPGGHLFEPGFALSKRLLNFGYKGMVFGTIGMGAGVIGTSMSNGLLKLRKKMDPSFESPNKPPDVVLNSATWALHMGVSSNLRYQILNGLDMILSQQMSPTGFRVVTSIMRTLNNAIGGVSFVTLARLTGVQAAGSSEVDAVNEAEARVA